MDRTKRQQHHLRHDGPHRQHRIRRTGTSPQRRRRQRMVSDINRQHPRPDNKNHRRPSLGDRRRDRPLHNHALHTGTSPSECPVQMERQFRVDWSTAGANSQRNHLRHLYPDQNIHQQRKWICHREHKPKQRLQRSRQPGNCKHQQDRRSRATDGRANGCANRRTNRRADTGANARANTGANAGTNAGAYA